MPSHNVRQPSEQDEVGEWSGADAHKTQKKRAPQARRAPSTLMVRLKGLAVGYANAPGTAAAASLTNGAVQIPNAPPLSALAGCSQLGGSGTAPGYHGAPVIVGNVFTPGGIGGCVGRKQKRTAQCRGHNKCQQSLFHFFFLGFCRVPPTHPVCRRIGSNSSNRQTPQQASTRFSLAQSVLGRWPDFSAR